MKESCGKVWVSIYDVIVLHLSPGIEEFSSLDSIRKFTNSCKTDPTVCLQRTSIVGVHLINCKNVLHPPLNICLDIINEPIADWTTRKFMTCSQSDCQCFAWIRNELYKGPSCKCISAEFQKFNLILPGIFFPQGAFNFINCQFLSKIIFCFK